MAEISVLIPVRNGGENFARTIDCLCRQETDGLEWQLLLADDGSDPPVEQSFEFDLPEEASLAIVRLEGQGNRPRARNAAWRVAASPIILWLDADMEFDADLVLRHAQLHQQGRYDVVMGARIDAWRQPPTAWQRWHDSRAMGGNPPGEFPWKYFITGNLSMKKSLLERTGGFDEAIDQYGGEDTELGYRLHLLDAVFYWTPALQVRHLDFIEVNQHAARMVEYGGSGLRHTLTKHRGIENLLGCQWVRPVLAHPRSLTYVLMRIVTRVALWPAIFASAVWWAEKFGRPRILLTYISVGGCLLGLKATMRGRASHLSE